MIVVAKEDELDKKISQNNSSNKIVRRENLVFRNLLLVVEVKLQVVEIANVAKNVYYINILIV